MILVAGGTGRLGTTVANELCRAGHRVRVLSRGLTPVQTTLDPGVDVVRGDVRDPASLRAPMQGVEVLVSTIQGFQGPGGVTPASVDRDGNLHLVAAAAETGADVVLVSVLGAGADSPFELNRMKHAAEQALRGSGCPWTIVRPEACAETWVDLLQTSAGSSGRPLVFGRATTPIAFVSASDVAALVVAAVLAPDMRGRALDICGPEAVTLLGLAQQVMARRGWSGRPRRVPRTALHVMAHTVGVVRPDLGRLARAALAMDDMPARDDAALREQLPDLPRTPVSDVVAELVAAG